MKQLKGAYFHRGPPLVTDARQFAPPPSLPPACRCLDRFLYRCLDRFSYRCLDRFPHPLLGSLPSPPAWIASLTLAWIVPSLRPETEDIVRDVVSKGHKVDAKDTALKQAREVNGLRAMFGETYPDPVRVISVGPAIDEVLSDPAGTLAVDHSLEFCGGTHVHNSSDIGPFRILSEESIAKVG